MMLRYVWQKEIDKHLVLVDFQMGFSTGRKKKLIIHVPIQTILGFFVWLCALRLERWLSAIFQSLSLPFSHQEGRWLGDELETRCSSFFNFFWACQGGRQAKA